MRPCTHTYIYTYICIRMNGTMRALNQIAAEYAKYVCIYVCMDYIHTYKRTRMHTYRQVDALAAQCCEREVNFHSQRKLAETIMEDECMQKVSLHGNVLTLCVSVSGGHTHTHTHCTWHTHTHCT